VLALTVPVIIPLSGVAETHSAPLSDGTADKSKPEKNANPQASSNLKDETSDGGTSESQIYLETDPILLSVSLDWAFHRSENSR